MILAESYTQKPGAIPAYFDAMLDAQPPERFSVKFLENLGFTSTNDRLFIGILKDLGFLNRDGAPQPRYFEFLDRSRSKQAVAEGIRDSFTELFAINTRANELSVEDIKNKLRTLFAGRKTDLVIGHIAKTFKALCEYADFSAPIASLTAPHGQNDSRPSEAQTPFSEASAAAVAKSSPPLAKIQVSGLQYHINIVLPDTRDQAVYDAIFRSLREHLG
jgi:Family of unknown function (DUF5343)